MPAFLCVVAFLLVLRILFRSGLAGLDPLQVQSLIQAGKVTVLDVREGPELRSGVLPGALSFPLSQLSTQLEKIPSGPLLVYCASGRRSGLAAAQLKRAGRTEVWNLQGGISAWRQHRLPVVPPQKTKN